MKSISIMRHVAVVIVAGALILQPGCASQGSTLRASQTAESGRDSNQQSTQTNSQSSNQGGLQITKSYGDNDVWLVRILALGGMVALAGCLGLGAMIIDRLWKSHPINGKVIPPSSQPEKTPPKEEPTTSESPHIGFNSPMKAAIICGGDA